MPAKKSVGVQGQSLPAVTDKLIRETVNFHLRQCEDFISYLQTLNVEITKRSKFADEIMNFCTSLVTLYAYEDFKAREKNKRRHVAEGLSYSELAYILGVKERKVREKLLKKPPCNHPYCKRYFEGIKKVRINNPLVDNFATDDVSVKVYSSRPKRQLKRASTATRGDPIAKGASEHLVSGGGSDPRYVFFFYYHNVEFDKEISENVNEYKQLTNDFRAVIGPLEIYYRKKILSILISANFPDLFGTFVNRGVESMRRLYKIIKEKHPKLDSDSVKWLDDYFEEYLTFDESISSHDKLQHI